MNLLINAAQAVAGKGTVSITTRRETSCAVITISDSGCGIPADILPRIFDPFFTTKPVGEGTGLGLSISYAIIERHGGTIVVDSTPGTGTNFTVRIPLRGVSGDTRVQLSSFRYRPVEGFGE
jgi:two-component system NtrC family sensor kinase